MSTSATSHFHIDQSFIGPMVMKDGQRMRQHYASLVHWVEAAKLEPSRQDEILLTPSAQSAMRRSRANKDHWRDDWGMVRSSVVEQGICFYYLANEPMFGHKEVAQYIVEQLEMCHFSKMVAVPLHQSAMSMLAAPRIAFLGHANALDAEVSKRLRHVQRRYGKKWHLVHWLGRHSAWTAHDWALAERMPITYVGSQGKRLIGEDLGLFAQSVDYVIVFDDKDKKTHDQLCNDLRQRGVIVVVASIGNFTDQQLGGQEGEGGAESTTSAADVESAKGKKQALQPDLFGR